MTITNKKTKRDSLLDYIFLKGIVSSVGINRWGIENYMTSADVRVREFARDPYVPVRRIPHNEALNRGIQDPSKKPIAWYEVSTDG